MMEKSWDYSTVVFLDRDGTINKNYEEGPVYKLELFELLPGAAQAIRDLNNADLHVFVVTNQGGIQHKDRDFNWDEYHRIEERMNAMLQAEAGAAVDDVFVCHHADYEGCTCRKPETGLFDQAQKKYPFEPSESYMVGDSSADIIAGKRFGLNTILVTSGWKKDVAEKLGESGQSPDLIVSGLADASAYIIEQLNLSHTQDS